MKVPTCSRRLLEGLGSLANKYDCHVQSHAAESLDQVAWGALLYSPIDCLVKNYVY